MMAVVDFSDLQALSGYRQVSKVVDWLRENGIRFVVGGDGKPRTTSDMLEEDLDGQKERKKAAPILFEDKYGVRLKPYLGRVNGKTKMGQNNNNSPWPDTPMSEVWAAYESVIGDERQTLGWLLNLYKDSDRLQGAFTEVFRRTDRQAIEKLTEAPVGNDRFGGISLDLIDKRSIRSYLDTYPSPVAANRQIAVLKAACVWAIQRYQIPDNPCQGVILNREALGQGTPARMRNMSRCYGGPPPILQMMELSYLLRARLGEVLALRVDDVKDDHIVLRRSKGSEGDSSQCSQSASGAL